MRAALLSGPAPTEGDPLDTLLQLGVVTPNWGLLVATAGPSTTRTLLDVQIFTGAGQNVLVGRSTQTLEVVKT